MALEPDGIVGSKEQPVSTDVSVADAPTSKADLRSYANRGALFVLIGIVIYAGIYIFVERMVYDYTVRNRLYNIKTASQQPYDYVILGASHAIVLDYEDMNSQLEQMTGAKILNLSTQGGGVIVNRFMLDYFLAKHETKHVVYVLDSFAFYSAEWNEDRIKDVALFKRAPFDPVLARLVWAGPATRPMFLGYVLGFYKINNPDWFVTDITEEELTRFEKTYRPIAQIDRQRMAYLYPDQIDPEVFQRYLTDFKEMLQTLKERGIGIIVIKPPIPENVYAMLPQEQEFDKEFLDIWQRYDVEFHDFSLVSNDKEFYFNTDHLNRQGVLNFYESNLGPILMKQ